MPRTGEDILINDDLYEDKETKKGGKMITSLIAVFIVLIWIAIFALLIKLDVGGFGSSVHRNGRSRTRSCGQKQAPYSARSYSVCVRCSA